MICGTFCVIVCPPGVPNAAHGNLSFMIIIGQSPDNLCLFGKTSMGLPLGSKVEKVIELFIQIPVPLIITLLPNKFPNVWVALTMLPLLSTTTK